MTPDHHTTPPRRTDPPGVTEPAQADQAEPVRPGRADLPGFDEPTPPNWRALRNLANRRRFDIGATFDELSARSGLARSTVVDLLTGTSETTRLGSWHALAQALDLDLPILVAALDDPDLDQPDVVPPRRRGPSLTTLVRQIVDMSPPERVPALSPPELHRVITDMGYDATRDAVRLAKWRVDQADRAGE